MKKIFAILILLSSSLAVAKVGTVTTVDHEKVSVNVSNMSCMIFPGQGPVEKRSYTVLGRGRFGDSEIPLYLDSKVLTLTHTQASQEGCDVPAMDTVNSKANMFFGFVHGAPLTVTRTTRIFLSPNGNCYERLDEQADIDIGEGIVVTSHESEVKLSQECD